MVVGLEKRIRTHDHENARGFLQQLQRHFVDWIEARKKTKKAFSSCPLFPKTKFQRRDKIQFRETAFPLEVFFSKVQP